MKRLPLMAFLLALGVAAQFQFAHAQIPPPYTASVRDKISEQWDRDEAAFAEQTVQPKVSFHINKDGSIDDLKIVESCGNAAYDEKALGWIRSSAPFAPPPDGSETIVWDFSYPAVDMEPFMKDMQHKFRKHWKTHANAIPVQVRFKVWRDGKITDASVSKSSGNTADDTAALNTVQQASLLPLPAGAQRYINMDFQFGGIIDKQPVTMKPATLNNMAVTALMEKRFDDAISLLTQALILEPKYTYARDNLAIAYNNSALKAPRKKAQMLFYRAAFLQPDNQITQKNLAEALKGQDNEPNTAEAHLELARKCHDNGDYIGAVVHARLARQNGAGDDAKRLEDSAKPQAENQLLSRLPAE